MKLIRVFFLTKGGGVFQNLRSMKNNKIDSILILSSSIIFDILLLITVIKPETMEISKIYLPDTLRFIGLITGIIQTLLFLTMHLYLGRNHRVSLENIKDHRLIKNGFYRHIRHPNYLILIICGPVFFLLTENIILSSFWLISTIFITFYRIPKEEKMMQDYFGQEYIDYIEQTGALLPKWKQT